ncbi:hypothetical protein BGP_4044 [Beggiatoa sp. PS]|nr:hypothetical protein BGP_4044 [Beggiatoa sp. PS]
MIESELLLEKYRVQRKLSAESRSIREYLAKTRITANKVAQTYGFSLHYAQISHLGIQPTSASLRSAEAADA